MFELYLQKYTFERNCDKTKHNILTLDDKLDFSYN